MTQPEVLAVFNKSFSRQNEIMDKLVELLDKNGGLAKIDTILTKLQTLDVLTEEVKSMSAKITTLTDSVAALEYDVDKLVNKLNESNIKVTELTETITELNAKVDESTTKINELNNSKYVGQFTIEEHMKSKSMYKELTPIFDLQLKKGTRYYCIKEKKLFYLIYLPSETRDKVVEYFKLTEACYGDGGWYYNNINSYYGNIFAVSDEIYDEKISFLKLAIIPPAKSNIIRCYVYDNILSMIVENGKYHVKMRSGLDTILLRGLKKCGFCDEHPINNIAIMTKEQYMKLMSD